MLAILAAVPGRAITLHSLPPLVPWRPSLAVRFAGAMTHLNHHVTAATDSGGVVTVTVDGVIPAQLDELRSAARLAATRVSKTCRCRLRGYRVQIQLPGRGLQVVAAG